MLNPPLSLCTTPRMFANTLVPMASRPSLCLAHDRRRARRLIRRTPYQTSPPPDALLQPQRRERRQHRPERRARVPVAVRRVLDLHVVGEALFVAYRGHTPLLGVEVLPVEPREHRS